MVRSAIAAGTMFIAFVCLLTAAGAHEWYPADCCSGHDCGPIDDERVTRTLQNDYVIDGKWLFARDDKTTTRQSLSGRFHACFPVPGQKPKCIFVPPEGS